MNNKKMSRLRKQFRNAGINTDDSVVRKLSQKTTDERTVLIADLVRASDNPAVQLGEIWLEMLGLAIESIENKDFLRCFKMLHFLVPFCRFLFGVQDLSPIINFELFELFKTLLKAEVAEEGFQDKSDCVSEFLQCASALPKNLDLKKYTQQFEGDEFLAVQLSVAVDFQRNKLLQREIARSDEDRFDIWKNFVDRDKLLARCVELDAATLSPWEFKVVSQLCEQL